MKIFYGVGIVAKSNGRFEPRTVETGWSLGNLVEVRDGLASVETVATGATFFADSESRLERSR